MIESLEGNVNGAPWSMDLLCHNDGGYRPSKDALRIPKFGIHALRQCGTEGTTRQFRLFSIAVCGSFSHHSDWEQIDAGRGEM
jgi:hypothetical protein